MGLKMATQTLIHNSLSIFFIIPVVNNPLINSKVINTLSTMKLQL